MKTPKLIKSLVILFGWLIVGVDSAYARDKVAVIDSYADIALATYRDSLLEARKLLASVTALTNSPTKSALSTARGAWIAARVPYQQSEVFRFGNSVVDDWEGKVNAWPLDEGLIDYVDQSYGGKTEDNPLRSFNVIANTSLEFAGKTIDASRIDKALIADALHEADGVEANVATGYHAIEFLLWGQDLNGTGVGAGDRPVTDFDIKNCSNGNCNRRNQYLLAASQLLVDDLAWMVEQWQGSGSARKALLANQDAGLNSIIAGLGSLSYGELAGERIKLGLLLHDPEEEHDCFSDNTHNAHFNNIMGIENVYLGRYKTVSGTLITGPSLAELVEQKDAKLDKSLRAKLSETLKRARVLQHSADNGIAYDQLIAEGNQEGNLKVSAVVDALLDQTVDIKRLTEVLELSEIQFEGSDSLESPEAVFH